MSDPLLLYGGAVFPLQNPALWLKLLWEVVSEAVRPFVWSH